MFRSSPGRIPKRGRAGWWGARWNGNAASAEKAGTTPAYRSRRSVRSDRRSRGFARCRDDQQSAGAPPPSSQQAIPPMHGGLRLSPTAGTYHRSPNWLVTAVYRYDVRVPVRLTGFGIWCPPVHPNRHGAAAVPALRVLPVSPRENIYLRSGSSATASTPTCSVSTSDADATRSRPPTDTAAGAPPHAHVLRKTR